MTHHISTSSENRVSLRNQKYNFYKKSENQEQEVQELTSSWWLRTETSSSSSGSSNWMVFPKSLILGSLPSDILVPDLPESIMSSWELYLRVIKRSPEKSLAKFLFFLWELLVVTTSLVCSSRSIKRGERERERETWHLSKGERILSHKFCMGSFCRSFFLYEFLCFHFLILAFFTYGSSFSILFFNVKKVIKSWLGHSHPVVFYSFSFV